jgi:hypothetical protein
VLDISWASTNFMVLKCDYQYLFNKEKINTRIKEKHEREDFKKYMILSGM